MWVRRARVEGRGASPLIIFLRAACANQSSSCKFGCFTNLGANLNPYEIVKPGD